jgi:copper(I)-binding protein
VAWRGRRLALLASCALVVALVALVGVVKAYNGGTSDIVVTDAWARPAASSAGDLPGTDQGIAGTMSSGTNSVAYLTIVNRGDGRDKLIGVTADVAEAVEFHHTAIENNVASMSRVQQVDVPKHSTVPFSPGGYHLVLAKVRRDLRPGDTITLTLTFEHAGVVTVSALVRDS